MQKSVGFRLVLLTADGRCPRWMWEPLQAAVPADRAALVAVLSVSGVQQPSRPWMLEWYNKWERSRFLPANGLLDDADVYALEHRPVFSVHSRETGHLASALAEFQADVVVVAPSAEQVKLNDIQLPVWRIQFGCDASQHSAPGFWEVVERSLSSVSLVETSPADGSERVLETIVARTDPRSWIRNQLNLVSKASDLLRRWIPPQISRLQHAKPEISTNVGSRKAERPQTNLAVLRLLARFGKYARASKLNIEQWQLVFDSTPDFRSLRDPEVLTPPPDRFWTDPFLFERDGVLHVFVEEYLFGSTKGHIAVLSKSASGKWSNPVTVLERPYHLSYPFVFEYEGELLMLPETTAADRVELYRCVKFPLQWELDTILIDNFAGADATLWFQDGRWWMFTDVGCELYIFYSDSPRGRWYPHRGNPVKTDARSSRPAGRIFRDEGNVIRPAQDCSVQYGREVVFNKIMRLTTCDFEEIEIARLRTPWNGNGGCHTFNQVDGVTVVDQLVERRKQWELVPGFKLGQPR